MTTSRSGEELVMTWELLIFLFYATKYNRIRCLIAFIPDQCDSDSKRTTRRGYFYLFIGTFHDVDHL